MKVFGITGWKNTGKTGLTERLVAEFTHRGFTVSTIKHGHHSADVDRPGADSHRHREAGASEVVLATPARIAFMQELRGAPEPDLEELLARMRPVDLVLIEGYKHGPQPKIEAFRADSARTLRAPEDTTIRAVASDVPQSMHIPVFDLDDTVGIADFIAAEVGL